MNTTKALAIIIGAILIAMLPIGIVMAYLNDTNPAIPTLPGINFAYTNGITLQSYITVGFEDGTTKIYPLNFGTPYKTLAIYTVPPGASPITSITYGPVTITASITTDDPTATCTVSISYSKSWLSSAPSIPYSNSATLESKTGQSLSLSYATTSGTITTASHTIAPTSLFPASPYDGTVSTLTPAATATATFTFSSSLKAPPAPFTVTANLPVSTLQFLFKQPTYVYQGTVTVTGGGTSALSLLPMQGLLLDVGDRKVLNIAWQYIALELVGIALIGYAIFAKKAD